MNTEFLNKLLDTASEITMRYFGSDLNIESKSDDSPVTTADRESETAIRKLINETYPDHGILGEEFGSENAGAEYVWIIDPIDGTKAFINNIDTFANMVGLLKNGVPVMSGIGFPAKNERYIGIDNKAYMNGNEITVSNQELAECDVCFCGQYMFNESELNQVNKVIEKARGTIVGGDAYNYCRVAFGEKRVVVESDLHPYDFLPLVPILNGAGANITDWNGDNLTMKSTGQVVAGGNAYNQALEILND